MWGLRSTAVLVLVLLASTGAPLLAEVTATLAANPQRLFGADNGGRPWLYAPAPVLSGSSLSHWDTSATPSLLMEPNITPDLPFLGLDITPALMEDIGWQLGHLNVDVVDLSAPGTGLTDPTPFPGDPGNPAATFGEARMNMLSVLLAAWGNTLESSVDVQVLVVFLPQFCQPGQGAVLAGASTISVFLDETGTQLPVANTFYHSALAEALVGENLTGEAGVDEAGQIHGDVLIIVNSDIDRGCLGSDRRFSYRLDGSAVPDNLIDITATLLHELAHGLGMSNFTDEVTGAFLADTPGIFDHFTVDTRLQKTWAEMTQDERIRSATRGGRVVWSGSTVQEESDRFLDGGAPELEVAGVAGLDELVPLGPAAFGPPIGEAPVSGDVACLIDDAFDATQLNGCSAALHPEQLSGKIALIDRGDCNFTNKVRAAQDAGALAAIVVNNAGAAKLDMGGVDMTIDIPSVGVGSYDGNRMRAAICPDAALFLQDYRFQVSTRFHSAGQAARGKASSMTDSAGFFYFFQPSNLEVVTKVVDACSNLQSYLLSIGGLTNVGVDLTVLDMVAGGGLIGTVPEGKAFETFFQLAPLCP